MKCPGSQKYIEFPEQKHAVIMKNQVVLVLLSSRTPHRTAELAEEVQVRLGEAVGEFRSRFPCPAPCRERAEIELALFGM